MADYSTIKGFTIQTLASDPAATKGSWASGGALNTPRSQTAGIGTPTAAMSAGGNTPSATRDFSETYDGTTWTEGSNLNTARRAAKGAGSTTAGLVVGGLSPPGGVITETETYNGTSWSTSPASLTRAGGTAQFAIAGASSTSALIFGGEPGTTYDAYSETWNGTAWTEGDNLNTGRSQLAGAGIVTAALGVGGYPDSAKIESYDGTSWTEISADLGTARYKLGGSGTSTASLVYGGQTSGTSHYTKTESFNGSTWTEVADLATANYGMGNAQAPTNTNTLALAIAGYAPSFSTITEEWSIAPSIAQEGQVWYNSTSAVLKGFGMQGAGAWASAPSMSTGRPGIMGTGTQTAALATGGNVPPPAPVTGVVDINESYDGTSWTEVGDMTNGRENFSGGSGTQTATIVYGATPASALVEQWNGTAWTEIADINTPRRYTANTPAGTTTAALAAGGGSGAPGSSDNEEFNGTSWTEVGNLNFARYRAAGAGTSTALIIAGDANAPEEDKSETWNGTSWTAAGDLNEGGYAMAGAGTQSAAWVMGGTPEAKRRPGSGSATEHFNGTSWTEVADVPDQLEGPGGAGTTVLGLGMGGVSPSGGSTASYEWALADAIKTFTAS